MNIPKLRFPEFTGKWVKNMLGDLTKWYSGGTPPKDNPLYWNGDIPWISASSMRGMEYGNSELKITSEGLIKGSKLAKKGTLLILVRGSMLFNKIPIGITLQDVAFNQDVKCIEVNNKLTSSYILYWFIAKEPIIMSMVTGTGIGAGKLDLQDLKTLKINLPPLPEQTKIATFLTAVDKKLQTLKKKKSLLEEYKKGVMQKLFSQELRFKDENGKDFPEWEVKKLRDVLNIPEKVKPKLIDKEKLLTVKLHLKGVLRNESTEGLSIGSTTYYIRRKGQFIYGKQNLFNGAFGIIPDEFDGFLSSGDVPSLDINLKQINSNFLFNYLSRESFYKKLEDIASGSGSKRIHEETLLNVEVVFPTLSEQTKIANFLSAIDEKINHCQKQIEKTENWKKGLLQKMFV